MRVPVLLGLATAVFTGTVVAQTVTLRTLPDNAPLAYMSHVRENVLSLAGRETKLAPGGQIRGENNLLVLPAAVPKDSLVKYQLDKSGELYRAWILTKEETDRFSPPGIQGRPIEQILPKFEPPPQKFGEPPPTADQPTRSTN